MEDGTRDLIWALLPLIARCHKDPNDPNISMVVTINPTGWSF